MSWVFLFFSFVLRKDRYKVSPKILLQMVLPVIKGTGQSCKAWVWCLTTTWGSQQSVAPAAEEVPSPRSCQWWQDPLCFRYDYSYLRCSIFSKKRRLWPDHLTKSQWNTKPWSSNLNFRPVSEFTHFQLVWDELLALSDFCFTLCSFHRCHTVTRQILKIR